MSMSSATRIAAAACLREWTPSVAHEIRDAPYRDRACKGAHADEQKDPGAAPQKLDALALKKHCAHSMKDDLRVKPCKLALLRKKHGLTQEKLAKRAKITQSEVSRTELRDDCLISTLERYIAALGGELLLHVKIDGQIYPVTL